MFDFVENSSVVHLGKSQRIFLLLISFLLSGVLFFMRAGFNSEKSLDLLARSSIEPELAISNGRPTIIEFYADWCEVCQSMAPSMLNLKNKYQDDLDIVLLNVDNQKWLDLIEKYEVNGIPQLNLFDKHGLMKAKLIGSKSLDNISEVVEALLYDQALPNMSSMNNSSASSKINLYSKNQDIVETNITPMSHG